MIGSSIFFFLYLFICIKFHLANFVLGFVCTPPYTQRLFLENSKKSWPKNQGFWTSLAIFRALVQQQDYKFFYYATCPVAKSG